MANVKYEQWFGAGSILGGLLAVVLPILMGLGEYGITFSIYNIRTELQSYLTQGNVVGEYLLNFVGVMSLPGFILTALGMGLLVVVSRWVVETLSIKVKPRMKMVFVFVLASLMQGLIVSGSLPTFAIEPMVFILITGTILALVTEQLYKAMKWSVPI